MSHSYAEGEVHRKTRSIIAGVLRIPVEDVKDDSDLASDLGADSMDFIDIMFSLGQEFQVEFCPEGMVAKLEQLFGLGALAQQGRLTELGVQVFRSRRPEIGPEKISTATYFDQLNKLVTTESWIRAIREILEARPQACPQCGAAGLTPMRPTLLSCDDCGKETPCPAQAEVLETWATQFQESESRSQV